MAGLKHMKKDMDYSIYDTDKSTVHSYMPTYEEIFSSLRDKPINLLEIGVFRGGSLEMWKDFFHEESNISGIDNFSNKDADREKAMSVKGCKVHDCNITMFDTDEMFDIIIDDGSHHLDDVEHAISKLWKNLKQDGLYVIEDVQRSAWKEMLIELGYSNIEVYDLRDNKNRYDDILYVLRK